MAAALLGGTISGGINIAAQLITMQPQSLSQALRCMDWGQAGIAFAAGAVAGITGFGIFGGVTAVFGTGLLSNVAAGALAGVISGQYARLTELVLSGHTDQIRSTLFQPKDLVLDIVLGGIGGGLTNKISNIRPKKPILNNLGESYPYVDVDNYGTVPFPENANYTPPELRVPRSSTYRIEYINAWEQAGKPEPLGGWANYKIHHIQPLEYGGTNDISNLVHLAQMDHDIFTKWWAGGYGPK